MDRPTPENFYRYRNLCGLNRERTARLLKASVFYFSSPAQFNDPFDCKLYYKSIGSREDLRRKHQALYKKYQPELSRAERRQLARADVKRTDLNEFSRAMTQGLQQALNGVGVVCLSEFRDDVVLWSHYAAGHAGLCLGFQVAADASFFARAQPVCYADDYPSIDMLNDSPQKQVEAFILTKAKGWAYEHEWRIVDHDSGPGERAFQPTALCEVIFGARMTEADRIFVRECVAERSHAITFYEAFPAEGSYALSIERLDR